MKRFTFYIVSFILCYATASGLSPVQAQFSYGKLVGTLDTGPRDLALAHATSSDISVLSETFANPASLSFRNKTSIYQQSYHSWTTNIYALGIGVKNFKVNKSSFGVGLQYLSSGFNEVNPLGGIDVLQPEINRIQLNLSYSYLLAPVFSIGVSGYAYTAWNDFVAREHVNGSVGVIYTPSNNLSYSLQFKNLGYGLGYNHFGNGNTRLTDKNIEQSLEYGASLYFPERGKRKKLGLYASTETKINVQEIYYRFAGEFVLTDNLLFRLGYLNGAEDYLLGESESGLTFGLGFNISGLEFNYAVAPGNNFYNRVHQFGFSLKL